MKDKMIWEMTQKEFLIQYRRNHRIPLSVLDLSEKHKRCVYRAIESGFDVPQHVVNEYNGHALEMVEAR